MTIQSQNPSNSSSCPLQAYQMRNAGAVIHSHGMESCLITMINPLSKQFRKPTSALLHYSHQKPQRPPSNPTFILHGSIKTQYGLEKEKPRLWLGSEGEEKEKENEKEKGSGKHMECITSIVLSSSLSLLHISPTFPEWRCSQNESLDKITHMEMIKGIQGHGYHDELVVPIIENTAHEGELTASLTEAIAAYPKATAVLVRNHGVYIWGDSWISAKTQAECYHYLFDAAIKLHQLGLDWSTPSHCSISKAKGLWGDGRNINGVVKAGLLNENHAVEQSRHCIVLDIEGTTTPISFVTDVLFPYARDNVRNHLTGTYDSEETQDDIKLLRAQVEEDLEQGVAGSVPIPPDDAGKEEVIASLVANVEAMIRADRKITALKQLQGHIWRTGFQSKELQGLVFEDVPEALEKWHAMGIKVYIYSSGSREAQRLLFGNTVYGDLRKYLCGFFDTTVGNKRETRSYMEISQSLGVDKPSQILFITDVLQEAVAAKAAGLEVIISIRPGNSLLPENHGFQTVNSFAEI
ncbi:haloacid dehalogenase-like hydrolase family protein isoform X4 [Tasmannia lanceolata]|uniref:haloacid dehalogenase-like hydrolase family protein isoform X4 n=1 Tax=Tasmannia lanceolata TaxID=3420 RepID=UPI004062A98A